MTDCEKKRRVFPPTRGGHIQFHFAAMTVSLEKIFETCPPFASFFRRMKDAIEVCGWSLCKDISQGEGFLGQVPEVQRDGRSGVMGDAFGEVVNEFRCDMILAQAFEGRMKEHGQTQMPDAVFSRVRFVIEFTVQLCEQLGRGLRSGVGGPIAAIAR